MRVKWMWTSCTSHHKSTHRRRCGYAEEILHCLQRVRVREFGNFVNRPTLKAIAFAPRPFAPRPHTPSRSSVTCAHSSTTEYEGSSGAAAVVEHGGVPCTHSSCYRQTLARLREQKTAPRESRARLASGYLYGT
jgi:hypothetical protein